jgi:lipid-binding SYLF domain-containing protein
MNTLQLTWNKFLFGALVALTLAVFCNHASASTAEQLDRDSIQALNDLYKNDPVAESLSKKAKAILVFPNIVKAGFVFGGSYGEGVLIKKSVIVDYYNSVSASWGWQVGVQSYGYVVFLMTNKAVDYLEKTKGWEFGVGPTITVVDAGIAKNLTTSTLRSDAYAFIFDQKGLMVSLSIEGTKISHIKR